ncbi:MAG: evbL [Actinomycetota bacterium]|nr:evbL [Actinomycetota bacterium]
MTLSLSQATELAAAVAQPLGAAGAAFYFHKDTLAKGKELGLDGMRFYMLGRGSVLGDAPSGVVASAFGYFNPATVAKLWDSAKEKVAPAEAASTYHLCCAEVGRQKLADVDGLDAFCDAAEAVIAGTDIAGLALYAGIAAMPRVDDVPGKAMQLAATLRELRGSVHLNALIASSISPAIAHCVQRPEMIAAFGWDPAPDTSGFDESKRAGAEALTDAMVAEGMLGLTEAQAAALRDGAAAIAAALAA